MSVSDWTVDDADGISTATHSTPVHSMNSELEFIKLSMLEEYERAGHVDVSEWTTRYPQLRDAIIDYWILLRGTTRLSDIDPTEAPALDDTIAEEAFSQAREAVALGPQWLEPGVADPNELDRLGASLERLRSQRFEQRGKAPLAFRRAAVFAWTVAVLAAERSRVSRFQAQKAAYFLERALQIGLFTEHQQMPFGPYDHTARYKDAEPIAQRKGWLLPAGTTHFVVGPNSSGAGEYATRYVRSEDLARRLLKVLSGCTDDQLETWATVDWAARELVRRGEDVTPAAIRRLLGNTPVWSAKLDRPNFADSDLQRTLQQLVRLRLVRLH
jgi:hypothetical protein